MTKQDRLSLLRDRAARLRKIQPRLNPEQIAKVDDLPQADISDIVRTYQDTVLQDE